MGDGVGLEEEGMAGMVALVTLVTFVALIHVILLMFEPFRGTNEVNG